MGQSEVHLEKHERQLDGNPFTLATFISLAGLLLVLRGCKNINKPDGIKKIVFGRTLDLVDGPCARALNQTSGIGATIDATCDKIAMTSIIVRAWQEEMVPKPIIAGVAASTIINAVTSTTALIRHPEIKNETPKSGKLSIALFNGALFAHSYGEALRRRKPESRIATRLKKIGTVAFIAGVPLALHAAGEYYNRAKADKIQK